MSAFRGASPGLERSIGRALFNSSMNTTGFSCACLRGSTGLGAVLVSIFASCAQADEWPEWMGAQRDGVWRETGIVERFPEGGPKVLWRVPVNAGYVGPAVMGDRLICLVGGTNSAVVAFHRDTGKGLWRALTASEIGYAPPVIHTVGGVRQLVIWHPEGIAGLGPETGQALWRHPYPVGGKPQRPEVTIA